MSTIQVACKVPNGIRLALFEKGADDGTGSGYRPMVRSGPLVTLNGPSALNAGAGCTEPDTPGLTNVDEDFMRAWLSANQNDALVTGGFISIVDDHRTEDPVSEQAPQ